MNIISRIIHSLAGNEVIDLYFVLTDLKDIPISEREACETAYYDSAASRAVADRDVESSGVPLGKQVL